MNYNERTGEFEKSYSERIGYWIGCQIWRVCKILMLATVCWLVWNISGRLFDDKDHEEETRKVQAEPFAEVRHETSDEMASKRTCPPGCPSCQDW